MGFSMGASVAREMAGAMDQLGSNVDKVHLVEPVDNQSHGLRIGERIGYEIAKQDVYFSYNSGHGWLVGPIDQLEPKDQTEQERAFVETKKSLGRKIILGLGALPLVYGRPNRRLGTILQVACNGLQDADITLVNFDASIMSRADKNQRTAETVGRVRAERESEPDSQGRVRKLGGLASVMTVHGAEGQEGLGHTAVHSVAVFCELLRLLGDHYESQWAKRQPASNN